MLRLNIAILMSLLMFNIWSQEAPNKFEWVDHGSGTMELLRSLYNLQGLAPPSSSGPFTQEEIAYYLKKINKSDLAPGNAAAYATLDRFLTPTLDYQELDIFAVDTAVNLSFESYLGVGNGRNRIWDRGWGERPAMVDWINKFWFTSFSYVEFHMDARQDPLVVLDQRGSWTTNGLGSLDQLDGFFPSKGYLTLGVPHLEFKWGRSPLEWGQGATGNLLISNAAGVYDHLSLSAYGDWFKLQLLYLDMDSYTLKFDGTKFGSYTGLLATGSSGDMGRTTFLTGLASTNSFGFPMVADVTKGDSAMDVSRRLVSHRFEFRLPGQVNLTITEALLFTATTFELRHLMPMFIYHNWFQQWNANPNFTIEAEWTPVPGLTVYTTILGDYVTTTFKDNWFKDPHPLAMGYQLGLRTAHNLNKGILTTVLEGVYIDPYTYLDEAVDWVSLRRVLSNYQNFVITDPQVMIIDSPLGYFLGPDSAVALFRTTYQVPGVWSINIDLEAQAKGLVTLRSLHPLLTNSSDTDALPDQNASAQTLFGPDAMRTFIVRLGAQAKASAFLGDLLPGLEINQSCVFKWVKNGLDPFITKDPLKPLAGYDYFDFQWNLGVSYKFN